MSKHRDLDYGEAFPPSFTDALEELISTYVSPNFNIEAASATSIRIVAGTGNDQVACCVNGKWRYVSSTITKSHPAGVAGTYDVFVIASDNNFVATGGDPPEDDQTNYAFDLKIIATGGTPSGSGAEALYRKVASISWSGSAINFITQLVGQPTITLAKLAGALKPSTGAATTDEALRKLGTAAGEAAAGTDSRFPSAGEKSALAGTSGTPGSGNKYVTDGDARVPSQGENDALAGTSGTPGSGNPFVTNADSRLGNSRPPSGAAGGVLAGSFPNPGFAVDMATQAELDAAVQFVYFEARTTADFTNPHLSETSLAAGGVTEIKDTHGIHAGGTNRIVIPATGVYRLFGHALFFSGAAMAVGNRYTLIRDGGGTQLWGWTIPADPGGLPLNEQYDFTAYFAAGQILDFFVNQTSGADMTILAGSYFGVVSEHIGAL